MGRMVIFWRPISTVAAAMNRALVEAGFAVHHLTVESASLEEVFLKMTKARLAEKSSC